MRTIFAKAVLAAALCLLALVPLARAALPGATAGPHDITPTGIRFIANYEKLRLAPYDDPVHCTVGFGHKLSDYGCRDKRAAKNVAPFTPSITEARALVLFRGDLQHTVRCVNEDVTVALTAGQFDALVSFAFNAGCGAVANVAKFVDKGDLAGAEKKMNQYVHGEITVGRKGHQHKIKAVLRGLVRRRREETQLITGHLKSGKPTPVQKAPQDSHGHLVEMPDPPVTTSVTGKVLPKSGDASAGNGKPADKDDQKPDDGGQDKAVTPECPIGTSAVYSAVPDGCEQFSLQITPSLLSTDPTNHFGYGRGGGQVEIEPIGYTLNCANPGGVCSYTADLPRGTTVTLVQTALNVVPSPAGPGDPVDSAFGQWGGHCSGSGASCSFALNANHMAATATFVPALATLTVNATGAQDGKAEVIVNPNRGADPAGPSTCSDSLPTANQSLPCTVKTRMDATVTVSAATSGDAAEAFSAFGGDACAIVQGSGGSACGIYMDGDHTVTAQFAPRAR